MGKVLLFIFENMTDYEITFITHLLVADANKEVVTIAYDNEIIKSRSGLLYKPNKLVSDVISEDVEALIIPGGWFGDTRPELISLIQKLNYEGKLISAICGAGTVFLAKAGILSDVKYTTPIIEWTTKHIEIFGEHDPFPREICDWLNLFENQQEKENFTKLYKG